jgi:hypothetical protein
MPFSYLKRTCSRGEYLHFSGDNPIAMRNLEQLVTQTCIFDVLHDRQFHHRDSEGFIKWSA